MFRLLFSTKRFIVICVISMCSIIYQSGYSYYLSNSQQNV